MTEAWGGAGGGWGNPVVGSTALRIPAINSPNFNLANPAASPTPSWAILQSGLAYFFGLTLTGGTITGPDYIIDPTGIYLYSGTPALGNLVGSWVPSAATTTDPEGNTVQKDITIYMANGGYVNINSTAGQFGAPAVLYRPSSATHINLIPQSYAQSVNAGAVNEQEVYVITSGLAGVGLQDAMIKLLSESADTTGIAAFQILIGGVLQAQLTNLKFQVNVPVSTTAGTSANPSLITTDSFHAITLDANWSTLGGQPVPSYQLTADGMVQITGAIQFNVNITSGTNINSGHPLPAAYRPTSEIFLAGARGSAGIAVQTNGVIFAAVDTGQTTTFCNFNGRYPLNL